MKEDGSIIFEERGNYDPKAIGKSYLGFLRKYNESKPHKNP